MTDVTAILSAIEQGDPHAAEQLLPLVYDELRKLAAQKLAQEKPGQTLQATALVHEAYLRLVDSDVKNVDPLGVAIDELGGPPPAVCTEVLMRGMRYRIEHAKPSKACSLPDQGRSGHEDELQWKLLVERVLPLSPELIPL
jgi:hypothetical protein